MPHAIALSPHLDDAVFSCGGTLALLARSGWTVTICTAFTRTVYFPTGFALACQLDKGLPQDVDYMALRRAEDTAACALIPARPYWLDLPEAPHRGYDNAEALFGQPHHNDDVSQQLSELLSRIVADPPALVLAPQAIGGHVDHVLLSQSLRRILPRDLPVWWWTDFPYAIRSHSHPSRPFAAEMEVLPEVAVLGEKKIRLAACAAYTSQIGFQFSGVAGLTNMLEMIGPFERFREGAPDRSWRNNIQAVVRHRVHDLN